MRRTLLGFAILWLAGGCHSGSKCEGADYSACGGPFPALQSDGRPWPTFSEALAEANLCTSGRGATVLRGTCGDGKQFIFQGGGFGGTTQYFKGEKLVGQTNSSDIASGPCQCPGESFYGSLQTVRCDAPMYEALCGSTRPTTFEDAFAQGGLAFCQCDDPSY